MTKKKNKNEDRQRHCRQKRVQRTDVPTQRQHDAVKHSRDSQSRQKAHRRSQHLNDKTKNPAQKDSDGINGHQAVHIAAAEKYRRRDET